MPSVRAKDDASTLGCRQAVRHQTLTLTCVGSNPAIPAKYDPLAQSVEQLPFKQWVWSSNLQRVTKKEISPRGYLFFDTRGDSKNSMEQSGGLFLGIGSTMPTPYPVPLHRAANLQRVTAHQRGCLKKAKCPNRRTVIANQWCSAQRIKTVMIASGNHTVIYRRLVWQSPRFSNNYV